MSAYNFGMILRELRTNHNLTQAEFGSNFGLSKAVVSKYENGMGYPTFEVLIQIASFFGVTTDYLLGVVNHKTIDVSTLTEGQISAIYKLISEFNKANK